MKLFERFSIENQGQNIVHCENCNHEIDISNIIRWNGKEHVLNADGLDMTYPNILHVINKLAECCVEPKYTHIDMW